ncbi:hypothetical protein HDU76_008810 [Blyttiomyces sp. JEL0837]|nr:hypothetical protein HDU76_008810 [Blyttiomyces sp. JEL0837]
MLTPTNLLIFLPKKHCSISKDSTKSQIRLATLLLTLPVTSPHHNPTQALFYLRRAATDSNNPEAKNLLGQMLEMGIGDVDGISSVEEAIELYRSGAEQGHAGSLFNLATCYEIGVGVNKDFAKAVRMFEEAARLGSEEARERLELLELINNDPNAGTGALSSSPTMTNMGGGGGGGRLSMATASSPSRYTYSSNPNQMRSSVRASSSVRGSSVPRKSATSVMTPTANSTGGGGRMGAGGRVISIDDLND